MRDRDRPRLAKFLSYGDSNVVYPGHGHNGHTGFYVYGGHNNNVNYPPPKPPTSPVNKRKSRSKTKAKRAQSKPSRQDFTLSTTNTTTIFDNFPSFDNSPPRKRRSPSKSRLRRSHSKPAIVLATSEPNQLFSLPPVISSPLEPSSPETTNESSKERRSRSKTRVKRTQSTASNLENEPPPAALMIDPPTEKHNLPINNSSGSPSNNKKLKSKNKMKIRRSQSEAPHRILSDKSLWDDLTSQAKEAKENIQQYIYKKPPTAPQVNHEAGHLRCQCDQYPVYPVTSQPLQIRSRSKSRSRKSFVSTAGPYSLTSVAYVAPACDDVCTSPLPGVTTRGRSKSRSRLNIAMANGMTTVWPDSRGAWLPA